MAKACESRPPRRVDQVDLRKRSAIARRGASHHLRLTGGFQWPPLVIGIPQVRWFRREHPMKNGWFGGTAMEPPLWPYDFLWFAHVSLCLLHSFLCLVRLPHLYLSMYVNVIHKHVVSWDILQLTSTQVHWTAIFSQLATPLPCCKALKAAV